MYASTEAATGLGRTYDPGLLARRGAPASMASAGTAADWYRRGAALGDASAGRLLLEMTAMRP